MGNCVSNCFGAEQKPPNDDRRVSHVYIAPFIECPIVPSDKHDDRFFYIKNEDEIDKTIDRLDETVLMNEVKAAILGNTIVELRSQRNKLTLFNSYDSADDTTAVREVDEEQEESSPIKQSKTLNVREESPSKQRRTQTMTDFTGISLEKVKKEIKQGSLLVEVQKAHFLHAQFLKKYDLCKPYVMIKIYRNDVQRSRQVRRNSKWADITKFQTPSSQDSLKPSWDELFEHHFNDQKKVSAYSVGFSLFYMFKKDHTSFQVGDEQIFSIGSLLDQSMQIKHIDFKDLEYKGVLARLRVRFQFIHDKEELKERLGKDIKAKMERLSKIRDRHPVFQNEGKDRGSFLLSLKRPNSKRESEWSSRSSTHEHEERGYYVAEKFDI